MKWMIWVVCLGSLFGLAACRVASGSPTADPLPTSAPANSTVHSEGKSATLTRPASTVTPSPSSLPSATATSIPGIYVRCFPSDGDLPENAGFTGEIAFETRSPGREFPISFLNLQTGMTHELPEEKVIDLISSANGQRYAYLDFQNRVVRVFTSEHKLIRSMALNMVGSLAGWLGDEKIHLSVAEPEPGLPRHEIYPPKTAIIEPFEDRIQIIPSDYPGIDRASDRYRWYRAGVTLYDPTLTRVIYPGATDASAGYILYDRTKKKYLAKIPNDFWYRNFPQWSSDGSKFVMMANEQLVSVSADGDITTISQINPHYNPATQTGIDYAAYFYNWSPDGKWIAMWLLKLDTGQYTLAILDPNTRMITDTCIQAGFDADWLTNLYPYPVWSPDGKAIVVPANYHSQTSTYDVVLVDVAEQVSYTIGSNQFPVGWLISQ